MLGGESPGDPDWLSWGTWSIAAQAAGALLVLTEHRFYGQSQPFEDLGTDNLRYLTSGQSLADHAALHGVVTAAYNLTASTQWISFGGSYSGALSAWMRMKYPAQISAAVASSAPVLAVHDYFQYLEVATASLGTTSHGAAVSRCPMLRLCRCCAPIELLL